MDATVKRSAVMQTVLGSVILAVLFVLLVFLAYQYLPMAPWGPGGTTIPSTTDWRDVFLPSIHKLFQGENPYGSGLYNPPWVLVLLSPLALFPVRLSAALACVLNFVVYGAIAYRLGAKPLALAAFLISPLVMYNGYDGNLDWFPTLGLLMPPQIGLFFVLAKPQIGIGVAAFWAVEAWRKGGWKEALRVFAPVSIAFLLSFGVYGLWPINGLWMSQHTHNASLFPWSIPLGLSLLAWAIWRRKFWYSVMAGPFLAPYLMLHSYAPAQLALGINSPLVALTSLILWVLKFAGVV